MEFGLESRTNHNKYVSNRPVNFIVHQNAIYGKQPHFDTVLVKWSTQSFDLPSVRVYSSFGKHTEIDDKRPYKSRNDE